MLHPKVEELFHFVRVPPITLQKVEELFHFVRVPPITLQ
jgi:hypothetical protein